MALALTRAYVAPCFFLLTPPLFPLQAARRREPFAPLKPFGRTLRHLRRWRGPFAPLKPFGRTLRTQSGDVSRLPPETPSGESPI